ncbi:MAG: ATP-dependent DNA helicase RecG [Clostridiales bacterium]|nr:ATP-dependent DNA helicase RecG [Clostridiales bacterium]
MESNSNTINISEIKGVGPAKEKAFQSMGIFNIKDLLCYYPRDYHDRTVIKKITTLEIDEFAVVEGIITKVTNHRVRRNLSYIKIQITDGTSIMYCTWFNQDYLKNKLKVNVKYLFFGKVIKNKFAFEFNSPEFSSDKENFLKLVPIYRRNSLLTQNFLRKIVNQALIIKKDKFIDVLPLSIKDRYQLLEYNKSIINIHYPESTSLFFEARKRLVFEELFLLQLLLLFIKQNHKEKIQKLPYSKDEYFSKLIKNLSFTLTNSQKKVIDEVTKDLFSNHAMNRLVQGDVGSGKTIIAIAAMLLTIENGYQSAFMVPTEILSIQHYQNISKILENFNISIVLLHGKMKVKEKKGILEAIKSGQIDMVIGTHAIIQDTVSFLNLGLVITDEQHRFGVEQRSLLTKKGENPNVLVMTATPIPRTLALILYGDLDISIIDEMPKGRLAIETYMVDESKRLRINDFIKQRVKNNEQVFIVCPSIDESDKLDIANVTDVYEKSYKLFIDYEVGMIHGKMKNIEKEEIMKAFVDNKIQILVSTTVIEVGVDIKNATLMVVENADRFGIAQLHQLRGRVGRSDLQSYCVLYNQSQSKKAINRLKELANSNDGFYLSEQDLIQRGPGEFFGTRQHGIPELNISNLYLDGYILKQAQEAALLVINDDDKLLNNENKFIREIIIKKLQSIVLE